MRRVYQNAQEIFEDRLRKIKYTKLKKSYNVFLIDEGAINNKKKINLRRKN